MVRNIGSGPEVAIQTRNIVTEGYDPEGKDKIEVGPGETMRACEYPYDAALRAIQEEWGVPMPKDHVVHIYGGYERDEQNRRITLITPPLPIMVNNEYDYPWVSVPVVLHVDGKLEFDEELGDGEAKEGRFMPVQELLHWLEKSPQDFFRLTYAGAKELCRMIIDGKLEVPVHP